MQGRQKRGGGVISPGAVAFLGGALRNFFTIFNIFMGGSGRLGGGTIYPGANPGRDGNYVDVVHFNFFY